MLTFQFIQILLILAVCHVASFGIHDVSQRMSSMARRPTTSQTFIRHTQSKKYTNGLYSTVTGDETMPEPSAMRVREIKDELNAMGVSFADCFDKDSLVERLIDARSGKVSGKIKAESPPASDEKSIEDKGESSTKESSTTSSNFEKEAALTELRSKKVRELRTMCAQNNIRWAQMIEKEELVQALLKHQEKAADFSPSGKILPGKVAVIDDDILSKEIAPGAAVTPLLLDVYATWCGPCKMMAPFLEEAASELGDKVRVAKMDSDQNPYWSGKLEVKGLPTVIVFDGKTGKELERVEGALMKDQLVQFAMKYVR